MEPPVPSTVGGLARGLRWRPGDLIFHGLTAVAAAAAVVLVLSLTWRVVHQAFGAIGHFGIAFVWHSTWDPIRENFGALDFIVGTLVSSLLAVVIATPLALATALFLTELAPRWLRGPVGTLIELLASIPSVVLGLWGILVLGP
ncbi:MAG: PstC family ABC transporter permease, partial [Gaiellaceae bacterium]